MRHERFLLFRIYEYRDADSYGSLYDVYYPKIRRYLHFRLPTPEDAEEATAEVFLRGWEYMTSSRVEHAGALFYRMAKNISADFYRTQKKDASLEEAYYLVEPNKISDRLDVNQEVENLIQALPKLKEEYRDILVMRFIDELSVKEISNILEKTPNTIRVLLHRSRKALKKIL